MESYVNPSGSAGTAPDLQEVWESAFGTETVSGGVSVAYTLASTQVVPIMSITRMYSTRGMLACVAAVVDSFKLTASGADALKCSASGMARRSVLTGHTQLNGIMSATATCVIDTIDVTMLEPDSVIQVGANNNTSTGYRVTAKAAGAPTMTLEATQSAADDAVVLPFVPAETTAGRPLAGIDGSVTLNSIVCPVTGFEVEIANNLVAHDGEFGAVHVSDFSPGWREVKGSITFRVRADQNIRIANAKNGDFATQALTIVCGGAAGRILTLSLPRVELGAAIKIEVSDDGSAAEYTLAFVANESTVSANDAITATFT